MAQNSPMEECICREDWVESGGMGKVPQPEAFGKQAGWVKSGGIGKTPQPEACFAGNWMGNFVLL